MRRKGPDVTKKTLRSTWGRRSPETWQHTTPNSIDHGPTSCYSNPAFINRSSSSSSDTWAGSNKKPHKASNDAGWEAIRTLRADGPLGLSHFRIIQKLGSGDIGSVYLAELKGTECYFAIKVMDKKALRNRNKTMRAETEREILEILDHPFLPTLYGHLDESRFTCLVMEVCPGGDLHEIRQRQRTKRFSDRAARFYASEVLLALEYLHMLGIVYRDLKPENVLVREDGHIMLTDFDLSMKCSVHPTLQRAPESDPNTTENPTPTPPTPTVTPPRPLGPPSPSRFFTACVMPCTSGGQAPQGAHAGNKPCFSMFGKKKRKPPKLQAEQHSTSSWPVLLAEPTDARSMSFVGTHEYLAPEIVAGEGHGNAVDWWTLGIFIFELLYGHTPFIGSSHDKTLANVVTEPLHFPDEEKEKADDGDGSGSGSGSVGPTPSPAAKDLIRGLLVKDPTKRMASTRGASEIKQHAFFRGVNWALIRSSIPPYVPTPFAPPPPSEFEDY